MADRDVLVADKGFWLRSDFIRVRLRDMFQDGDEWFLSGDIINGVGGLKGMFGFGVLRGLNQKKNSNIQNMPPALNSQNMSATKLY